jgi:hypothetical protein
MGDSYTDKLEGTANEYLTALRKLAAVGRRLHTTLFKHAHTSAMAQIGHLLASMPPARGSIVTVSVGPKASDFLFPWAMIYDRPLPKDAWELPDRDGFWGFRYCIEQRLPAFRDGSTASAAAQKPARASETSAAQPPRQPLSLRMAFMLWDQFRNAREHLDMIKKLAKHRPGSLEPSLPPITRASDAFEVLRSADPGDLLYFYTHAHVRRRGTEADDAFLDVFRSLAPDSASHAAFEEVYGRSVVARQEPSWIGLTYGRLTLDDLYAADEIDFSHRLLVILNACQSAQLTPTLTGQSFVHFFLDRGAATFLGTECTMTVTFAHPFAEVVLRKLLDGETVGSAVLAARNEFAERRNPLGLAYSLYGNAALSFSPRELIVAPTTEGS